MGEDFQYESAGTWFKQMDKLIHYVNKVSTFFGALNLNMFSCDAFFASCLFL